MRISPVSTNHTNFNARFIPDSQGILKKVITDSYYTNGISYKTVELADSFNKLGNNQELVILDEYVYNYKNEVHERGLEILNKTSGKTGIFAGDSSVPFWDAVLSALVKDKDFYKTNTDKSIVLRSLLNG